MRVALVYLGRRGGGAAYSLQVAKALSELCNVTALISSHAENLHQWRASQLDLLEIPTYTNRKQFLISTMKFGRLLHIAESIQQMKASVLYYPMLHPWTPLLNSLLRGIPKVVTVHDPVPHMGERHPGLAMLQRWSTRQATRVIVLHNRAVDILAKHGVDCSRIDVIPHGEFSFYRRVSDRRSFEDDFREGHQLLFFGRILPYKGLGVLLEALKVIRATIPAVRLDVVGAGDLRPYRSQLEALGEGVRVVNRWVADEEVDGYFRSADLVVLPYVDASQSGVVPIAYSYKLAVVASDVGGLGEQVIDGETGILVPPGNVAALAAACIELLQDPARRKRMGEAAYEKAMTEWNWDQVAWRVYQSLEKALR